ncbi:hypothetical protein Tco_0716002 [Tanacetum coccineum]
MVVAEKTNAPLSAAVGVDGGGAAAVVEMMLRWLRGWGDDEGGGIVVFALTFGGSGRKPAGAAPDLGGEHVRIYQKSQENSQKKGQARTRESEEYKKKPKNQKPEAKA